MTLTRDCGAEIHDCKSRLHMKNVPVPQSDLFGGPLHSLSSELCPSHYCYKATVIQMQNNFSLHCLAAQFS